MKIKLKISLPAMKSDGLKVNELQVPVSDLMPDGLKIEHCKEHAHGTNNCDGSKVPVAALITDGFKFDRSKEHAHGTKNSDGLKVKETQTFELPTENAQGPVEYQSDSDSVKIIDFSSHFSPYKSHLARELSQEMLQMEKQKKRSLAIAKWDWDSVVDLGSSPDEDSESELSDTADSAKPAKKIPRVTIHRRNKVLKLIDESSEYE